MEVTSVGFFSLSHTWVYNNNNINTDNGGDTVGSDGDDHGYSGEDGEDGEDGGDGGSEH